MSWLDFFIPQHLQVAAVAAWALKSSPLVIIGSVFFAVIGPRHFSEKALGAAMAWGCAYAVLNAYMTAWWPGYGVFLGYVLGGGVAAAIWFTIARAGRSLARSLKGALK